ncbi:MAG: glutathione transferase GstA [Candidatus Nitrotoga sp.]|nr:glutathione transferase GstA [Candidatus Nitrotoga sp.]
MKLFYSPGACTLSPHITLRELQLPFELVKVDLATKTEETGVSYWTHNPKGYVPALLLDNGELLTEGPAIVQYLADLVPEKKLAPANGTMERYRLQEMLNFITSELHKGMGVMFKPQLPADWRVVVVETLGKRMDFLSNKLGGKSWLMGETFTVADAYLFTVLRWSELLKFDMSAWPELNKYVARVAARPAVQDALKAEGLA